VTPEAEENFAELSQNERELVKAVHQAMWHGVPEHSAEVMAVAWSPDSRKLATASSDRTVCVFNVETEVKLNCMSNLHQGMINAVAWHPTKDRLATGSNDFTCCVVDVESEEVLWRLAYLHTGIVWSVAWSPDGTHLATGSADHTVSIIDYTCEEPHVMWHITDKQKGEVRSVAWSADGTQLAAGAEHSKTAVFVVDVYGPFRQLVQLLLCCKSSPPTMRANLALCAAKVSHWPLLLGQRTHETIVQNEHKRMPGWSIFHDLATYAESEKSAGGGNGRSQVNQAQQMWNMMSEACPSPSGHETKYEPNSLKLKQRSRVVHGCYRPFLNDDKHSALDIAIENFDAAGLKFFLSKLERQELALEMTDSLSLSLVRLARRMPRELKDAVVALEGGESLESRQGSGSLLRVERYIDMLEETGKLADAGYFCCRPYNPRVEYLSPEVRSGGKRAWSGLENEDPAQNKIHFECEILMLAIGNFCGPYENPSASPFHALINNCPPQHENELFGTKTIIIATQFKWDQYARRIVVKQLLWQIAHFALAAVALVLTTCVPSLPAWAGPVLHAAMATSNSFVLFTEMQQLYAQPLDTMGIDTELAGTMTKPRRAWEKLKNYISDGWNRCDMLGVCALYTASCMYVLGHARALQSVGALGILFNSVNLLQPLRPFAVTGPLIKMISSIVLDIRGYMGLFLVILVGYSIAFAIAMPNSTVYGRLDPRVGPFIGLLSVFDAMLGNFDWDHCENPQAVVMLVIFALLVVVVMLNLLIALMGDIYQMIKQNEVLEARKLRAGMIMQVELTLSKKQLKNTEWFPRFVQILQADERGAQQEWGGLGSKLEQLKQDLASLRVKSAGDHQSVESKIEQMVADMKTQMATQAKILKLLEANER
jgi:hypothetical protein